jgi:streptomycin 6-kinase
VDRLSRVFADLLEEWRLRPDGDPRSGHTATVLPVLTDEGRPAVLKVGTRHPETEHEHLALQHWHGDGAVLLLRADPRRMALLLERLSTVDLSDHWDVEACEIVAGFYPRLHKPAPPQLTRLSAYVARHVDRLDRLPRDAPVPRRMVEQGVSLGHAFAGDPATDGRLLHADLHYENVLAGDREPWLAIDPQPLSGDPHYEPAPLLWNRLDELAGDVRGGLRRRFHTVVDAAGLDEDRARDWVVVRMLVNVLWELEEVAPDPARLTAFITVAKAVQE